MRRPTGDRISSGWAGYLRSAVSCRLFSRYSFHRLEAATKIVPSDQGRGAEEGAAGVAGTGEAGTKTVTPRTPRSKGMFPRNARLGIAGYVEYLIADRKTDLNVELRKS